MATTDTNPSIETRLNGLMGRTPLSADAARESMRDLERRLSEELSARRARQVQSSALRRTIYAPIIASAEHDQKVLQAVDEFKRVAPPAKKARVIPPQVGPVRGGIVWNPLGATLVPPFPYAWHWTWTDGDADGGADANAAAGTIDLWTDADHADSGSASARGALGIYFYPPTAGGWLQLWATPAISWYWSDYAVLDTAHTDAFLGLYVGSYDLGGAFTGAPVDQLGQLWNDTSHFTQTDDHGTDSGRPLSALIPVDNDHQYILWVWGGVSASGPGNSGYFSGGGAWGNLAITIPSITWSLT